MRSSPRVRRTGAPLVPRVALLVPGGIALLAGLDAALLLLGVAAPVPTDRLPEVHGMLMVLGFVGTVVALERAVALGRAWGYVAPAVLGLGGLRAAHAAAARRRAGSCWSPAPRSLVAACTCRSGAGSATDAVLVQAGGAVLATRRCAAVARRRAGPGAAAVAGRVPRADHRRRAPRAGPHVAMLDPRRGTQPGGDPRRRAGRGAGGRLLWPAVGYPLLGAALLASGRLAGPVTTSPGAPSAPRGCRATWPACLLAGYGWLAVAGAIWLLGGPALTARGYDAVVHAVFLGFVMSMIMAHAPVILPAVLRRPLPYHPVMYVPAALLHASLAAAALGRRRCAACLGLAVGRRRSTSWRAAVRRRRGRGRSRRPRADDAAAEREPTLRRPWSQGRDAQAARWHFWRAARPCRSLVWLAPLVLSRVAHPFVPAPRWLMVHLLLLGAVTHAILVWSRHFADALLRSPRAGDRRGRAGRLLAAQRSAPCWSSPASPSERWPLPCVGGDRGRAAPSLWHGWCILLRGARRAAVPVRTTVRYYVGRGVLPARRGWRSASCSRAASATRGTRRLVVAHVAVNLLGWIGLTVHRHAGHAVAHHAAHPDRRRRRAATRARALPVLVGSVLVTAGGALVGLRVRRRRSGLLGYLAGLVRGRRPVRRRRRAPQTADRASPTLVGRWPGWSGCVGSLVALGGRAARWPPPRWQRVDAAFGWLTPFLAVGFCCPGAARRAVSYLVPVVARRRARRRSAPRTRSSTAARPCGSP